MADGTTKQIGDVKLGDHVATTDPATGGSFLVWEESRSTVTVSVLILRIRQASARRRGQPFLIYTAASEAFKRYTVDTVMVGRVGDRQHSEMLFQLYLNPETQAAIC